jgi:tRNA pseudouridine synthase 10
MSNRERGENLRTELSLEETPATGCWLCEGIMDELETFAALVEQELAGYEFDTFLIGCRVHEDILKREREIALPDGDSIKREINREVGKRVAILTGKTPEFVHPDVVAVVNTTYNIVEVSVNPVFVYGRYRKLVRGIPQTKWFCRKCRGRGCDYCDRSGKMYAESVEELIAGPAVERFAAGGESFHGAGREDIDVRMLGSGRPFILQLDEPKRRRADLPGLETAINTGAEGKVTVSRLRYAKRDDVEKLKAARFPKTYRTVIAYEPKGNIKKAVNALSGAVINQRTPNRVAHRRADKIRRRKVLYMELEELGKDTATVTVTAESGTYIKELMTGDEQRTSPSLSELAGCAIRVESLDVLEIGDENETFPRV